MRPVGDFIFAALILLPGKSSSQELSQLGIVGRAERASDELIDRSVKDANGEVCAGLVVVSDLDGVSFDSNIGKLNPPANTLEHGTTAPE